ncbi:hypothetical protein KKA15_00535 [Patescibacteria group bacterium]|nr:hypothetical protein [Patescibacteria group bacterium]
MSERVRRLGTLKWEETPEITICTYSYAYTMDGGATTIVPMVLTLDTDDIWHNTFEKLPKLIKKLQGSSPSTFFLEQCISDLEVEWKLTFIFEGPPRNLAGCLKAAAKFLEKEFKNILHEETTVHLLSKSDSLLPLSNHKETTVCGITFNYRDGTLVTKKIGADIDHPDVCPDCRAKFNGEFWVAVKIDE